MRAAEEEGERTNERNKSDLLVVVVVGLVQHWLALVGNPGLIASLYDISRIAHTALTTHLFAYPDMDWSS